MTDLEFVNPQIKNTVDKELSIQVSLSGFSFFIQSASEKSFLAFKHYAFEKVMLIDELIRKAEDIIETDNLFKHTFKTVSVNFLSQKSTLIPSALFDVNSIKALFEFNYTLNELDELHHTFIPEIDSYNVFSIPNYLANVLFDKFGRITFKHQATELIKYGKSLKNQKHRTVLHINNSFFDIAVFEDEQLLLHNSFQYTNAQDFIYFFLYPLNQLKLDPKMQYVHIFADKKSSSSIINEVRKVTLKVISPKVEINLPTRLSSKIDKSAFYNLFVK